MDNSNYACGFYYKLGYVLHCLRMVKVNLLNKGSTSIYEKFFKILLKSEHFSSRIVQLNYI